MRMTDASWLFRFVANVLALRPMLARPDRHLRVESGLLSGIDFAAEDSATTMVVQVLAAVLEFQRSMISENTHEGMAAVVASGKTLGRLAALGADQAAALDPTPALDVPGLFAEQLHDTEHQTVRQALAAGRGIRRGQGYSVRGTAPLSVHQAALDLSAGAMRQVSEVCSPRRRR
ncbi:MULTISPECIES: recombinase family protein [unclassified Streptomyces]|uniref:recombinase family protein n=1 Tax=unclassified Streptomyces TaxID=2593676 RepID=UPI0036F83661